MDLSQFSNRCVFLPPVKTDYALSQSQKDNIRQHLVDTFTQLKESGIDTVLCIGGMNLDYERYDIRDIIPCILVYHSPIEYLEAIEELYQVSIQDVLSEMEYFNNVFTYLPQLIYHDAKRETVEKLKRMSGGWEIDEDDVDVDAPLINKYYEEDLLFKWLKQQKVLASFASSKHPKGFKTSFDKNKSGLKLDINMDDAKYYVCGNLMRKDLIFK